MPTISWPWAIILCKYNDVPNIPQQPYYYEELFTRNGTGGICDYWREVSCNSLDLTGSKVFGWFTMNHSLADQASLHFPGDRHIITEWGVQAALASGVNFAPFRSLMVITNDGNDHGFAGNGVLIIHKVPTLCEFGFICHEMGHGFGLPHSWAAGNPDMEYGDGWDVMSWQTTTFNFTINFLGTSGLATVGMNARNVEALESLPLERLWAPAQLVGHAANRLPLWAE